LCGFGVVHPLPGIWDAFRLNTAITLPIGVEAYGAYALGAWLTPGAPGRARKFAKRSAIGALMLGMAGQVAYHILAAAHALRAPTFVVVLVACLPVVTLGFGAGLAHLLRDDPEAPSIATVEAPATAPAVALAPEAVSRPKELAKPTTSHRQRPRHKPGSPTIEKAEREFAEEIAPGSLPSVRAIKRRLNVGDPKAQSYRAHFQAMINEQQAVAA